MTNIFRNNESAENIFEIKSAENEIVDDKFDEFVPSSSEMEGFRIVKSSDKQKETFDQEFFDYFVDFSIQEL